MGGQCKNYWSINLLSGIEKFMAGYYWTQYAVTKLLVDDEQGGFR